MEMENFVIVDWNIRRAWNKYGTLPGRRQTAKTKVTQKL